MDRLIVLVFIIAMVTGNQMGSDKIHTRSGAMGLSGGLASAHWKCDLIFASKGLCFISDNDVRITLSNALGVVMPWALTPKNPK